MLSWRRAQPWAFMDGIVAEEARRRVSRREERPVRMKLFFVFVSR